MIARFGGDEFVCSLTGQDLPEIHERFEKISALLAAETGQTFTVGFAERGQDDTLEQLILRADTAMIAARQHPFR